MSKPYIISYDLDQPGQRYAQIKDKIEDTIGDIYWTHYLESTYLVRSSNSATEILHILKPFLDKNDKVMIFPISESDYSGWLETDQWDTIQKYILFTK